MLANWILSRSHFLKPFTANASTGTTIVTCNVSELLNTEEVRAVGRFLVDLGHFKQNIVIDFRGLSFVTSEVLAYLVTLRKNCVKQGLKLALCDMGEGLKEAFKITSFERIFDIHDSLEQALFAVGDRSGWVSLDQHSEVTYAI